jgi:hypothetical protein
LKLTGDFKDCACSACALIWLARSLAGALDGYKISTQKRVTGSHRRRWAWFGLIVSVLTTLYCYSGVVMNAHFSMIGSAAKSDGHMLAAKIFAALTLVGFAAIVLCGVVLGRTRPSRLQALNSIRE